MTTGCKRLPLERYAVGELEESERAEVRRHIETCSDCSLYIAGLETERADFLRNHPFSSFTRAHAPVVTLPWYRCLPELLLRPALVPVYGILLLTLVVVPLRFTGKNGDIRFKGPPVLSYIYEREGKIGEGAPGLRMRAGDRIQVFYSIPRRRYVGLLSIDSRGTVSFYHPDGKAEICSVISKPGDRLAFPGSILLDETPGDELVIALFSSAALRTGEVVSWAKRQFAGNPDLVGLSHRLPAHAAALDADIATLLVGKD